MKVEPACFPCILRRILSTAGRITDDQWLHHKLLGEAMQELVETERDATPAETMLPMESLICKTLGSTDPYQKQRAEWYEELEGLVERIGARVHAAPDPLETALLLAARANAFDDECLTPGEIREELARIGLRGGDEGELKDRFACSDFDLFLKDLEASERLLFLHDSGPELPFDRILLECLHNVRPNLEVTCVVRARPILLDATHADSDHFELSTIPGVTQVIDPGIHAIGTPLNECSREFRDVFENSDLVIGKGQAHYETLEGAGKNSTGARGAYFLMRVKCAVMAKNQGVSVGDLAFVKS